MFDDRKRPGAGAWAASIAVGLILLPVLYLLLLGPVFFLHQNETLPDGAWSIAALPAQLWLEHVGTAPEWFWQGYEGGYLLWWGQWAGNGY